MTLEELLEKRWAPTKESQGVRYPRAAGGKAVLRMRGVLLS